jgi:hypothetical protein
MLAYDSSYILMTPIESLLSALWPASTLAKVEQKRGEIIHVTYVSTKLGYH